MAKKRKAKEADIETEALETETEAANENDNEVMESMDFALEGMNLEENEEEESFLPDAEASRDEDEEESELSGEVADIEGSELDSFEAAEIEETEFIEDERLESILESILFASDRPVSLNAIKQVFKGTNIKTDRLRRTLDQLAVEYAGGRRGVSLEEVPGGWQLRTKVDNMNFLRRTLKTRTFRVSGPALEVLSIVAYKQPIVKHEIDEIRGVESGHLLRALMEKGLVTFLGKSELPGRPMQYGTTRKFLEIFSLRNLKELPTLSQIDELLPEGITEEETTKKQTLADVTSSMSEKVEAVSYSTGEEELEKIQEQLEKISTSSDFFEQEKQRQKEQRDRERAQNILEALAVGEDVPARDKNWLKKYEESQAPTEAEINAAASESLTESAPSDDGAPAEETPSQDEAPVIETEAAASEESAESEEEVPTEALAESQ